MSGRSRPPNGSMVRSAQPATGAPNRPTSHGAHAAPTATPTAVADALPYEPGGYNGYQALFGHRYLSDSIGGGTPNATQDGVPVTNAAGHLTDEFGNQLTGDFTSQPGFPGYGEINAAQTLSYAADMLTHGVQVVNMYIADIHGNAGISGNVPANDPNLISDCA